jgi:hypothetical protein
MIAWIVHEVECTGTDLAGQGLARIDSPKRVFMKTSIDARNAPSDVDAKL